MDRRKLVHTLFLLALPVIVAGYGFSVAGAIGLVVLALAWRWAITLSGFAAPPNIPDLELETIAASHFAEKARWCMDRLGIEYREKQSTGILGVLFTGRTVPRLRMRTGFVRSEIGNSAEILRYLWGRYGHEAGEDARFLAPTAERVELEQRIDRYGAHLQVWVYYHILDEPEIAMRAWGRHAPASPAWQRALMPLLFPVYRLFLRRVFRIDDKHYEKVSQRIDTFLADIDGLLDDGRRSILGDDDTTYVDISFAAISSLWMRPAGFGGGHADSVLIDPAEFPEGMRADIERWRDRFPLGFALAERLYREERISG
jgi:glutathione S-transferase